MNDRYTPVLNKETYLFDIFDNVMGDKLMGSYATEERAKQYCQTKNTAHDLNKLHNFKYVNYKGPVRSVQNAPYRTPKLKIKVTKGMVVVNYE